MGPYTHLRSLMEVTSGDACSLHGRTQGLDICPTSNQLLGTVPGQGLQSPLKQFLEAGVPGPQPSQLGF